jgi:hypothetical protein
MQLISTHAEIGNSLLHVQDHLSQVHAWAQELEHSTSLQKFGDIVACLEDTVATLLSLFLAAPVLCGAVMRESDHALTTSLAHLHDVLLSGTLQRKLAAHDGHAAVLRDRVAAISVVCAKLSCLLLSELLQPAVPVAGPSTSKPCSSGTSAHDGAPLLAALVDMQVGLNCSSQRCVKLVEWSLDSSRATECSHVPVAADSFCRS